MTSTFQAVDYAKPAQFVWSYTVPASGKLTHSAGWLGDGRPQVKRRFYRRQEAFVIAGILDFCRVLLFVNRLPDNSSRNNDNSCTVGY